MLLCQVPKLSTMVTLAKELDLYFLVSCLAVALKRISWTVLTQDLVSLPVATMRMLE